MQLIWLVHELLPAVCMYSQSSSGQYVQPNGLPYSYEVEEIAVSAKLRDAAAVSHSVLSVMRKPGSQLPLLIMWYVCTHPSGVGGGAGVGGGVGQSPPSYRHSSLLQPLSQYPSPT
jgi:hypothetical protein